MERTQKSPAAERSGHPSAQRFAASNAATVVDNRPEAVAPRNLADTGHDSPRTKAQQASIRAVLSSPRVVAQANRIDGSFGAAQLRPDPANASYRPAHMRDEPPVTGPALRPSAPIADPLARPIQRRDMRAVMIDQHAREKVVSANAKSKSKAKGKFTTVGFEWDIAETRAHSEENPNVLEGITHVELADSGLRWNGLQYHLETDAGNVLEFVTPPFYVRTQGGGSLPDLADLADIVDSTRTSLKGRAAAGTTIGKVMADGGWNAFALGGWTPRALEVDWHNWSPRAAPTARIQEGIAQPPEPDNEDDVQRAPAWHAIEIGKATLDKEPQINIAVTASDYGQAQEGGSSRLGKKDEHVKRFTDLESKLQNFVAKPGRATCASAPEDAVGRLDLVIDQAVRVLAQVPIVSEIEELAALQQRGLGGENVTNAFSKVSGGPSYIKDTGMVWLKTDLFTFAASALRHDDWARLAGDRGALAAMGTALQKAKIGESLDKEPLQAILVALQVHAEALAGARGSTEDPKKKSRETYILNVFKEVGDSVPAFNEHSDKILGVRQDTFIKPETMLKLSNKLQLGGMLSVMEVRNSKDFLKWLRTGEKKKGSSGSSIEEMAVAPSILGATLFANVTAGDGNCFFHALYESQNAARSSAILQRGIRHAVLNALGQRNDICQSHFGPGGTGSPEYQHYAAEILTDGAWVSDQTPAIVSDALNLRITIHNPDGTVYFDAEPNAFGRGGPAGHFHVMYTGNHYNSYTNPALP